MPALYFFVWGFAVAPRIPFAAALAPAISDLFLHFYPFLIIIGYVKN